MSSVLFPMSPLGPARTNVNSTLTPLPALHELKEFAFSATPLHGSAHLSSSDSSGSSPESIRNDSSGLFDSPRRSCESPYTEPEVQANVECLPETTRRPDVRDLAAQQALPGATSPRTLRLQLHNLPRPMPGSPAPIAITFVDAPSLSGECSISFDIIGRIAEGRFSQVWGAIAHSSHPALRSFPRHISIKMTWKGSLYMCANALSAVWNETRIMKQLAESRTPFVNAAVAVWQDDNYVYVASPRHTGALDEYLYTFPYMPSGAPPKVMPPAMFRVYAAELLLALDGLRAQGIAHCDIKTSNVFVSPAGHLTLADFDCSYSGLPTSEDEYWNTRLNGYPGSAEYMAPESVVGQLLGRREDIDWTDPRSAELLATPRADMWGLGLVLLEIALQVSEPVFMRCFESLRAVGHDWDDRIDAMAEIHETWEFDDQLQLHAQLYPTVKSFLSKLLANDPPKRLTATQAMQDPLFSGLDWDELRAGKLPDGLPDPPFVRQPSDRYNKSFYRGRHSSIDLLRASGRGQRPMPAGLLRVPVSFAVFEDWVSPAVIEDDVLPGFAHGELVLVNKEKPCGCGRPDCQQPCFYF